MTTPFQRFSDPQLLGWAGTFSERLLADPVQYFITLAQAEQYAALRLAFAQAMAVIDNPATRTRPTVEQKRAVREELLKVSRHLASLISTNPACTDLMRTELGIGVRAERRRAIPVPDEKPRVAILGMAAGSIDLRVFTATNARSMGRDIAGADCYVFVGERPPERIEQWRFAGSTTRSRTQLHLAPSVTGQTVWITCRFVNARSQPGPASEPQFVNLPASHPLPNAELVKIAA